MAELHLSCRDRHRAELSGGNKAADVPDFLTPLDLQRSPSLERVGRLDLGSARSLLLRFDACVVIPVLVWVARAVVERWVDALL